jgi:hypothetical protein
MVTPLFVGFAYYVLVAVFWFWCFVAFRAAPPTPIPIGPLGQNPGAVTIEVDARLGILVAALIGPLLLRVPVEFIILFFRMNESLTSAKREIKYLREDINRHHRAARPAVSG